MFKMSKLIMRSKVINTFLVYVECGPFYCLMCVFIRTDRRKMV